MHDDFAHGNELPVYVTAKFNALRERLWPPHVANAVKAAGCDIEDHQRGLRSWAHVGSETISLPGKGSDPSLADYDAIRERTRPALDAQLRPTCHCTEARDRVRAFVTQ